MPRFRLSHEHDAEECGAALVAWKGFESPLRGRPTLASCAFGGHRTWWDVDAGDAAEALGSLPGFVAARTEAVRVDELEIP